METKFRHIARAVIVHQNQILIARMKGAHSFLPGGGVEVEEGAKSALKRELKEELGLTSCQVGRFLGVIEQCYEDLPNKCRIHEITHLFEVQTESLDSNRPPTSFESHLEFYWSDLTKEHLTSYKVLPELLQEMLPSIINDKKTQWMSTIEN